MTIKTMIMKMKIIMIMIMITITLREYCLYNRL